MSGGLINMGRVCSSGPRETVQCAHYSLAAAVTHLLVNREWRGYTSWRRPNMTACNDVRAATALDRIERWWAEKTWDVD